MQLRARAAVGVWAPAAICGAAAGARGGQSGPAASGAPRGVAAWGGGAKGRPGSWALVPSRCRAEGAGNGLFFEAKPVPEDRGHPGARGVKGWGKERQFSWVPVSKYKP